MKRDGGKRRIGGGVHGSLPREDGGKRATEVGGLGAGLEPGNGDEASGEGDKTLRASSSPGVYSRP